MLNPETLRRKTQEAIERKELERQREEERRRQEEEARRLAAERQRQEAEARRMEAERQRQEEARKAQLRKVAARTVNDLVIQAVQTAAQGSRTFSMEVSADLIDAVEVEIQHLGLRRALLVTATTTNIWCLTLQKRLNKLAGKLDGTTRAKVQMIRLAIDKVPSSRADIIKTKNRIESALVEILAEKDSPPPSDARTYINLIIKPHLENIDVHEISTQLDVRWVARDALDVVLNKMEDVPSWLLSTSGWGLIERINQCMSSDADQGYSESIFKILPLPITPDRWGQNTMSKFVHNGQPIGVSPFSPEMFAQAMKHIGFEAKVAFGNDVHILTLGWLPQ